MGLHTFAPVSIPGIGAAACALFAVILFVTRGGKLPLNFSERTRLKYLATMFADLVLGVFYLCVALGNHHFGHNLLNGHWSPTGMWLAFGFASTGIAYALGLSQSQNETYAWVYTFFQALISAFLYIGSRNIEHEEVPKVMAALAGIFWGLQSWYFLRWCTPSEEWQNNHGKSLYFIFRVFVQLNLAVYWVFFIVDVTLLNKFNDHEQNPWIAYLIANVFLYGIYGLLANLYFNPDHTPPIGIWSDISDASTGLVTNSGNTVLRQDLEPNPAASAEQVNVTVNGNGVPATAGSSGEYRGWA